MIGVYTVQYTVKTILLNLILCKIANGLIVQAIGTGRTGSNKNFGGEEFERRNLSDSRMIEKSLDFGSTGWVWIKTGLDETALLWVRQK